MNNYDKEYLSSLIEGMLYTSKGETPMPELILDWIEEHVGVDSNLYYGFEWCIRHGRKPYHLVGGCVWLGAVDRVDISDRFHLPRSMETWLDSNVMAVFPCLADAFEAVGLYWKAHDYEHSWEVEIPCERPVRASPVIIDFKSDRSFFAVVKARTADQAVEMAKRELEAMDRVMQKLGSTEGGRVISGEIVVTEKLIWE